jgi:hypothetical protein
MQTIGPGRKRVNHLVACKRPVSAGLGGFRPNTEQAGMASEWPSRRNLSVSAGIVGESGRDSAIRADSRR